MFSGDSRTSLIVGLISKWNIALGALQSGMDHTRCLIVSALLATYLIPVVYMAFFKKNDEFAKYGEASSLMLVPIVTIAVFSLILGIFPNFGAHFYDLATMAAKSIADVSQLGGGW